MNQHVPPKSTRETALDGENISARRQNWLGASARIQMKSLRQSGEIERRPSASRAAEISLRVSQREIIATILLTIASVGTLMLTYFGVSMPMSELGGGLVQKGQALVFAITIGVFSWLGWFYLFGLTHWLRGMRLAAAALAGAVYVLSIALIDAPFNMLALAGGSAVQMSLVDTAHDYEQRRILIFQRATTIRGLIPGIRAQSARFKGLKEGEVESGAHSGKAGAGKVAAGFGQVAVLLDSLAGELETGLSQTEKLQSAITAEIAVMKSKVYTRGAIRERMEAVSTSADKLDDLLGRLAQFDYSASIEATLTNLGGIFPARMEASSAFEKVQNAELGLIADMAKPVAAALKTALELLQTRSKSAIHPARPADPLNAIKIYWKPLLPQWVAAFFVDLAPAILLVFLIAGRREFEAAENTANKESRS
jgi:hypothetical protein